MFSVMVERHFQATHAVAQPDGTLEPLHAHDWVIQASFEAEQLNADGFVVDFVRVQDILGGILQPLTGANLNEHEWFRGRGTSAELLARRLFDTLDTPAWAPARLEQVRVREAPGCWAAYRRRPPHPPPAD